VNEKLAFQAELRTYFGLSSSQVQEMTDNWNKLYSNNLYYFNENLPSPAEYQNTFGAAYWQWATGQITQNLAAKISIADIGVYEFAGYYEMYYFKATYFSAVAN
jgi:hypothetical protein